VTQAVAHVHLETVVGTDALGEPARVFATFGLAKGAFGDCTQCPPGRFAGQGDAGQNAGTGTLASIDSNP